MVVGFDPRHHLDRGVSVTGMEQGFDAGVETSRQRGATFGVERTTQMNHAVSVVPHLQVSRSALPFEPAHPAIGLSPSHFDTHGFDELVDREPLCVGQQAVATVDEADLVDWRQLRQTRRQRIDMPSRDRTGRQRRVEPGHRIQCGSPGDHPFRVTMRQPGGTNQFGVSDHEIGMIRVTHDRVHVSHDRRFFGVEAGSFTTNIIQTDPQIRQTRTNNQHQHLPGQHENNTKTTWGADTANHATPARSGSEAAINKGCCRVSRAAKNSRKSLWSGRAQIGVSRPLSSLQHDRSGADRFRQQFRWPSVRPELLRLAKRGNPKNCQPAVRSRCLIRQVTQRHRDQKWRTGPIHRSPATEAGNGSRKDR